MPGSRASYLKAMGIVQWRLRSVPLDADAEVLEPSEGQPAAASDPVIEPAPFSEASAPSMPQPVTEPDAPLEWEALQQTVAACTRCELHRTRTQTVFGTGSRQADWMFVGEAPGAEEDRRGEPFVGRAGKLLDAMLASVGKKRQEVYIANVLKCRPPNNRDPHGEEVRQCEGYLVRQIQLIKPTLLIAMGRFAAQSLLKTSRPISKLRGEVHEYTEIKVPLVVTYHPAYLLRNPIDKRKAWQDLCLIRRTGESP